MPDIESAKRYLQQALDALSTTIVQPGQSIQAAIDAAELGATIQIAPGTYTEALTLSRSVALRPTTMPQDGRATRGSASGVTLLSSGQTVTLNGQGVTLTGLMIMSSNPDSTIVMDTGQNNKLDRCAILGDPQKGAHRGLGANGQSLLVDWCLIDDCFLIGRDAQAVGCWDGTKDLIIMDSYLGGGAQSFMAGGADPASPDRTPNGITIQGCTLSKNPNWFSMGAQLKTSLELKNVIDFQMSRCLLEYAGISQGQGAYLIVMTPRNQGNTAPWSTVSQVHIENCIARYGGGCINMLGTDNVNPSGPLTDVTVKNVLFDQIDPAGVTKGSGRMFLMDRAPKNITLDSITVNGQNMQAALYMIGAGKPAPTGMVLNNMKLPPSKYGWKIDAGGSGFDALRAYCPDAKITVSPLTDAGASVSL